MKKIWCVQWSINKMNQAPRSLSCIRMASKHLWNMDVRTYVAEDQSMDIRWQ